MPGLTLKQMVVPNVELFFYLIGYVCITSFMFYSAYQVTRRSDFREYTSPDALGILVDRTCDTWASQVYIMQKVWWMVVLYIVFSKAMRQRMPVLVWSVACGLLGIAFILLVFELKGLLFMLAIVGFHLAFAVFRSRIALWMSHMAFFYLMSFDKYSEYHDAAAPPGLSSMMYPASALIAVRCLMFFNDVIRDKDSVPLLSKENVCTFLHFLFYPPTSVTGPIFTYGEFKKSLYAPVKTRYLYLGFRAFRLVLWAGLLHASFYIHYRAFLSNWTLAEEEDDIAFAGCLYLNGIRFYLIYVQAYGWPNVLGHLDGFYMPEWPRCISHIYSYAEMWKVFDRGLYDFIKNYIYIPLGGNRTAMTKLLSSIACFLYVVIYHGLYFDVFIWVLMNFLQIIGEIVLVNFYYSDKAERLHSALSPAWTRRLFGFIGAWSFIFSCLGFFYFDIGYEMTTQIMRVCGSGRFWLVFFTISYFLVHLAIECRVRGIYQERKTPPDRHEVKAEEKKDL